MMSHCACILGLFGLFSSNHSASHTCTLVTLVITNTKDQSFKLPLDQMVSFCRALLDHAEELDLLSFANNL